MARCIAYNFMRQVCGFSAGTLVFSNNRTDRHITTEILLKVVLNVITITIKLSIVIEMSEWLLFNAKWDIFHLYQERNLNFNELMMMSCFVRDQHL